MWQNSLGIIDFHKDLGSSLLFFALFIIKNYVATEFLYDHLRDKRSVGVIDEDAERAISYVAEPIGVCTDTAVIGGPWATPVAALSCAPVEGATPEAIASGDPVFGEGTTFFDHYDFDCQVLAASLRGYRNSDEPFSSTEVAHA